MSDDAINGINHNTLMCDAFIDSAVLASSLFCCWLF